MTNFIMGLLLGANLVLFGPGVVHYWKHRTDPLSARWLWLVLAVVLLAAVVESV